MERLLKCRANCVLRREVVAVRFFGHMHAARYVASHYRLVIQLFWLFAKRTIEMDWTFCATQSMNAKPLPIMTGVDPKIMLFLVIRIHNL